MGVVAVLTAAIPIAEVFSELLLDDRLMVRGPLHVQTVIGGGLLHD